METRLVRQLVLALGLVLVTTSAQAVFVHSYQGLPYDTFEGNNAPPEQYTTSQSISGYFTTVRALLPSLVDATIAPSDIADFLFTDGLQSFDPLNTTSVMLSVTTDATGALLGATLILIEALTPSLDSANSLQIGVGGNDVAAAKPCYPVDKNDRCLGVEGKFATAPTNAAGWSTVRVPEPAALTLLGLGMAGAGFFRRRVVWGQSKKL